MGKGYCPNCDRATYQLRQGCTETPTELKLKNRCKLCGTLFYKWIYQRKVPPDLEAEAMLKAEWEQKKYPPGVVHL